MYFNKSLSIFSISLLLIATLHCSSQPKKGSFVLEGSIQGVGKGTTVYFQKLIANHLDSLDVVNGKFKYTTSFEDSEKTRKGSKTKFDYLTIYFFSMDKNGKIKGSGSHFSIPIRENEKMTFKGDFEQPSEWVFSGTKEADLTMKLRKVIKGDEKEYFKTLREYMTEDGKIDVPQAKIPYLKGLIQENNRKIYDFIDSNPHTHSSTLALLYVLNNTPNENVDPTYKKELYKRLSASLHPDNEKMIGNELKNALKDAPTALSVRDKAPAFTQNDENGNPISLSSYRGKYVLIDFWASWCFPCRVENPNVVKAYELFKDKNFDVLGVSLDQDKTAWINAIKKDKLTWKHVSDLKGFGNDVAQLYNINAIPSNFLIDPNGNIIQMNLRGDQLIDFLSQVLGK